MRSVPFLTCLAAVIFSFALGLAACVAVERAGSDMQRAQVESIARQFEAAMGSASRMVTAQAEIIAGLPGLTQAVASKDRGGIISRLAPSFEAVRAQFGLDIQQVATRENIVLARVHDPERFGDDLTKTRAMVVQANVTGEPQSGLETGVAGLRMRSVVPIKFGDSRVGTIEVGQRVERILENLRNTTGADFAILLNPEAERTVVRSAGEPALHRFGDLVGDIGTNWPLFSGLAQQVRFAQVKERVFGIIDMEQHSYGMMQIALSDYGGHPIGILAAAKPLDEFVKQQRSVLIRLMTIAAVGAIMLVALILVVQRGLVLAPVSAAARTLDALVEGRDAPQLPKRRGGDQVTRLFEAVERSRKRLEHGRGDKAAS